MAPGNVSASEQVFLPYKQYSFTSLFVNREVDNSGWGMFGLWSGCWGE